MLFKTFKPPAVSVSLDITKNSYVLGETIMGNVLLTSDEELEANEVRVELHGTEKLTESEEFIEETMPETLESRLYSSEGSYTKRGNEIEYSMCNERAKLSEKLALTKGKSQSFPFKVPIPANLGPSFRGMRPDRSWLERTWTVKGVVAVGGRPDAKAEREISVGPVPQPAIFPPAL